MISPKPEYLIIDAISAGRSVPEFEHVILNNAWLSYHYSKDVIKGRWIEGEDIISSLSRTNYYYAIHVIEGKLPEKMHNMMILYAIKDSNDSCTKAYFEFIK